MAQKDLETARVRVRRDLHQRAKAQAALEGITIEAWLARVIEDALERR